MPMKRDITIKLNEKNSQKKVVVPSDETLNFIKQFARSYVVAKQLPDSISGFCVN